MKEILPPFQFFTEVDGSPLDLGKIYIGVDGLDAETNPQAAYWDSALTIPASQPVTTVAGYPWNTNAVGRLYTASAYSITIRDQRNVLVFQNLTYSAFYESALTTHEADTSTHGTTTAIVGKDDVQTLTNKTLTSPTINSPTITAPTIGASAWANATHTHLSAATGGLLAIPGMRSGLNASNSGVDPLNDIQIAAGAITDSTGAYHLKLASAIMGQLDGNWVAGTNQGKLDTGAKADATWYHVFIIGKTDGTTDILFSTSYSAPSLPAGYTLKAYSGRSFFNVSGAAGIAPFLEANGKIFLKTPVESRDNTALPVAAETTTLYVPTGLSVNAIFCMSLQDNATGDTDHYGIVSNTDLGDIAPSDSVYDIFFRSWAGQGNSAALEFVRPTNTSAAITTRFSATGGTTYYAINTRGWEIPSP